MKLWFLLTVCALAGSVSSMSIGDRAGRINGENGWYVPQVDGSLMWLSMSEANEQLSAYETLNDLEINERISLNAVDFYLYTQRNPHEGQAIKPSKESIDASNFNAYYPTRITIHGWNSNYKDGVNSGVRAAWFLTGNYNMIAVDWSRGRSLEYASSVAAVSATGAKIAKLVDFLVKEYGMSLDTLEIVGFSLGAHVAGHTAKQVATGKVQKVVGLDPAMPMLSYDKPAKRLSSNDAFYVETIQTNGGTLGYTKPIGRAAFYPNGGKSQPGCGIDLTGGCSHTRAVSYYVESLMMNNFPSMRCPSYEYAINKDCGSTYSSVRMGSLQNELMAVGEFYVPVNKESPYGLGDTNENETSTSGSEPCTTTPEDVETTVTPTATTPAKETTTTRPSDDDKGKDHSTNIYILNLIFVNSHVNKHETN
ncbi:phospholipase A1-like isoform X2 [Drosophila innubila]|uniref:phospholipase A1-like isoform X2 n=1 Tax=Drosophila innubila TaxID=198719 RepID=UPI00148BA26D|nr:phospholipase A1-like isoform X2 [Drosophila innubila]